MTSIIKRFLNARVAASSDAPVPYVAPSSASMGLFQGSQGGTDTQLRTMGNSGTIYAIVQLLSNSVAGAEWRMYRKNTDGRVRYTTADSGSDQRTEVMKHAALDIWNRPNAFMMGMEFVELSQQWLELTGECYWIVQRDSRANFPIGLWPVTPSRMQPVKSETKFLTGYVYTAPGGEQIPLGVDDVIFVKLPNPFDAYHGLGPVQAVLVDIDATRYSAEWNRNFFFNSAQPGGVITVDSNLTDEEFDELSNRWRESHQGVSRAHRVAILEGGAKFSTTQSSMRDMEFAELRADGRDIIREAWGIHKAMLGNSDDVNRANAQTAEEVFGRWKLIPRLERIKMFLNNIFLPMFGASGANVEFDYINPLPDDREADNDELTAKANAVAVLVNAGFDPADACEVVGLPNMRIVKAPVPTPMPALPPGAVQSEEDPQSGSAELGESDNSDGEPAEDDSQKSSGTGPAATNSVDDVDMAWITVLKDALMKSQLEVNN